MSKEHAYAYEAGYIDGSTHYELEHCPACKNVADLQEALAENERLRQENQSVGMAAYELGRASLAAENAKLRELCRRFSEYVSYDRCEGCVVKRRCNDGEVDECWQMCEIRKLARELRVEVER